MTAPEYRVQASQLLCRLRSGGIDADADLRGQSFKSQMRRAGKIKARYALLLGDSEIQQGTVQIKDLAQSTQIEAKAENVIDTLRNMMEGSA